MPHIRPTIRPRRPVDVSVPRVVCNPDPETRLGQIIIAMKQGPPPLKPKPFVPIMDYNSYVDLLELRGLSKEEGDALREKHKTERVEPPAPVRREAPRPLMPVRLEMTIKDDHVNVYLNTGTWYLNENYFSKCKIPPFIAILRAHKNAPEEYKAMLMKSHQKRKDRAAKMEEDFKRLFPDTKKKTTTTTTTVVKKALKAVKKI